MTHLVPRAPSDTSSPGPHGSALAALGVPLRRVKERAPGLALERGRALRRGPRRCGQPGQLPGPSGSPNTTICYGTGTRRGEGGTVGRKQESCQDKEFITEESCRDLTLETSEIFCVI